ncbi:MAG TPA: response regulator [Opitutaceae bacterium]|nr:response regulator [Opitutaceae bacterium]
MSARIELPIGVRRHRVLVVDGREDWRREAATRLEDGLRCEVRTAGDAYAAIRLTRARPDWQLLILNLDAAGMNGFEIYSRLRDAIGGSLRVMFLTGAPDHRRVQVEADFPPVALRALSMPWPDLIAAARQELGIRSED